MNHIGAEHSQKVAINIKITLLNNKYMSEYGGNDFVKEPSNAQLLTDQIHFRTVNADLGKQTLTRYNINSVIPQTSKQIWSVFMPLWIVWRVSNSGFFDLLSRTQYPHF